MCYQCETKPVYEFTNKRKLCKNCFARWFQKKVFYTIRKFRMLRQGDTVGYFRKNDFRSVVLEDVLKMLAENRRINLRVITQLNGSSKATKLAFSSTADTESYEIINAVINGKIKNLRKFQPVNKNIIKPMCLFLDAEIKLYAELKGLKFKSKKENKDKISKFIDDLEKKHPEIKRAVINGILGLKN